MITANNLFKGPPSRIYTYIQILQIYRYRYIIYINKNYLNEYKMRKNSKMKKAPVIIPTSCTYHMQVVGTQFKDFSIPNNLSQTVFNSREFGEEFFKI